MRRTHASRRAALAATAVLAALAFRAGAATFAYVPNEKSGTISIIDTADDQVVGEIKAGESPRGTAATADGKQLYVSTQPDSVTIIDLASKQVINKIATSRRIRLLRTRKRSA